MSMRVSIIDDHTLFRDGLQSLLEQHGLEVVASSGDGPSGIAAAARARPDVVLLDLRMPGMSGLEALRRLQAEEDAPPVVMLTTSDRERDLLEALRAGAAGYLLKDMEPDALVAALRQVAHGGTVATPAVAPALAPALARAVQGRTPPKQADPDAAGPFDVLTPREREVLVLLAEGRSNRSIAEELGISEGTVKAHVKAVLRKLGAESRVAAAVLAVERGFGK